MLQKQSNLFQRTLCLILISLQGLSSANAFAYSNYTNEITTALDSAAAIQTEESKGVKSIESRTHLEQWIQYFQIKVDLHESMNLENFRNNLGFEIEQMRQVFNANSVLTSQLTELLNRSGQIFSTADEAFKQKYIAMEKQLIEILHSLIHYGVFATYWVVTPSAVVLATATLFSWSLLTAPGYAVQQAIAAFAKDLQQGKSLLQAIKDSAQSSLAIFVLLPVTLPFTVFVAELLVGPAVAFVLQKIEDGLNRAIGSPSSV